MNILLDTQAVIWYIENEDLLTKKALDIIRNAATVYVSPVSFYEIAIKLTIGRNAGISQPLSGIIATVLRSGFIWLPLTANHIETYTRLPLFEQHRDPFDRMLLATALADELTIISSDHNFPLYRDLVQTIW